MSTIGARLRRACQRRGWNATEFHQQMEGRLSGGKSGTSYNAVLAYRNDLSEPSLEFIRQAADVLEVSAAWLAFGAGAKSNCPGCAERDARIEAASRALTE